MTAVSTVVLPAAENQVRGESLWGKARRRFFRHKLAMAGLVILGTMVLLAIFAPLIEHYPPNEINLEAMSQPPSLEHWLGTDTTGRDYWSRLVHGARVSLSVGLVAVSISTLIGVVLGSLAVGLLLGCLVVYVQDVLDDRFGSQLARDVFGYEPGWGLPGPDLRRAVTDVLAARTAALIAQPAAH